MNINVGYIRYTVSLVLGMLYMFVLEFGARSLVLSSHLSKEQGYLTIMTLSVVGMVMVLIQLDKHNKKQQSLDKMNSGSASKA